jgi:hypothetical protein
VTRSNIGIRLAAVLAGAAAATFALAGCGTGQVAETANKVPSVLGTNAELRVEGGSYKVRNLHIPFSEEGYEAGATAPLELALFNDTNEPVTVRITSEAAQSVTLGDASASASPSAAPSATPSGEPSATPSEEPSEAPGDDPSASPSAPEGSPDITGSPQPDATPSALPPAGGPASITIPPNGYVLLTQESGRYLQLVGLSEAIDPASVVDLTFDFGGQQLDAVAAMAPPLGPLPRSTVNEHEGIEGGEGEGEGA